MHKSVGSGVEAGEIDGFSIGHNPIFTFDKEEGVPTGRESMVDNGCCYYNTTKFISLKAEEKKFSRAIETLISEMTEGAEGKFDGLGER